jgi:glycosyltransferase involved in cell wall biosynthesis
MLDGESKREGKPSVAIVIQRYGKELGGGSELHCQILAERLCQYYDIEILTTCARDHRTWKNEYDPGRTSVNGITVNRFPVNGERDTVRFDQTWKKIFWSDHSPEDELDLLKYQGPYSPALLNHIEKTRNAYDAFLFFTYLYYPTALGLVTIKDRAAFQPTAHDEPLLYLNQFEQVFRSTPHLIFNSEEERNLLQRRFTLNSGVGTVVGVGIDNPWSVPDEPGWREVKQQLGTAKVITYVGRIEGGKGCESLVEFFLRYSRSHNPEGLKLLLLGRKLMSIPDHPAIIAPGFVSDYVKAQALASSTVSVAPSAFESLCMAALEAWYHACPVLANAQCPVLVGHCQRSNGGLWYENYGEFEGALDRLLEGDHLAPTLGRQGQEYVQENYTWKRIETAYREILDRVIAHGTKTDLKRLQ